MGHWGRRSGRPKQSAPLSFQPPEWRILQKKKATHYYHQKSSAPHQKSSAPPLCASYLKPFLYNISLGFSSPCCLSPSLVFGGGSGGSEPGRFFEQRLFDPRGQSRHRICHCCLREPPEVLAHQFLSPLEMLLCENSERFRPFLEKFLGCFCPFCIHGGRQSQFPEWIQ